MNILDADSQNVGEVLEALLEIRLLEIFGTSLDVALAELRLRPYVSGRLGEKWGDLSSVEQEKLRSEAAAALRSLVTVIDDDPEPLH